MGGCGGGGDGGGGDGGDEEVRVTSTDRSAIVISATLDSGLDLGRWALRGKEMLI